MVSSVSAGRLSVEMMGACKTKLGAIRGCPREQATSGQVMHQSTGLCISHPRSCSRGCGVGPGVKVLNFYFH